MTQLAHKIGRQKATAYIGITRRHVMADPGGIPGQWEEFTSHLRGLDPAKVRAAYGLVMQNGDNDGTFTYACAIPEGKGLAEGGAFSRLAFPALKLAKFAHQGHVAGIRETTHAIFSQALPAARLTPAGTLHIMEVYGPDFDPVTASGTIGLWVPVA